MKEVIKILTFVLALLIVFSVLVVPAFAALAYPMVCTIYYTDESGNTLSPAVSFNVNASDPNANAVSRTSPAIDGYVLKNNDDDIVTFEMMEKYFPPTNYTRNGTATYTVVYQKLCSMTGYYYYANGEIASSPQTVYGVAGNSYYISSPTVAHHSPDRSYLSGKYMMEADYDTVYYHRTYYTISYDGNGGRGVPSSGSKASGLSYQLSTTIPTRYGHDFLGWAKSSTSSVVYDPGDWISENEDLTLYAKWAPYSFIISYNANGGNNAPVSQTKDYGKSITLRIEEPTRIGYEFIGWATDSTANFATYSPGSTFLENRSVTLYAVWEKIPEEYAVRYHANGGSGAPATQTKIEGRDLTLSSTVPTRYGYNFEGWGTDSSTSTVSYNPGGTYARDSSITLYAIWSPEVYTISYSANGGSCAPAIQYKTYNVPLALSSITPTRYRYKFLGWSESSSATSPDYYPSDVYDKEGATTLYAVWEYINYDFSVSNMTITPDSVYQYDTVTVRFRLDSWDQKNAYADIPVTVYLGSSQIYSTSVDFHAYGVNYVSFELNIGSLLGNQMIEARV